MGSPTLWQRLVDLVRGPLRSARLRGYIEGVNAALDNAAMTAHDMGHADVRDAINRLRLDPLPPL